MRRISINFISQEDIRIYIDGEKPEDVTKFLLMIEEGESPKCSICKRLLPKQKEQKEKKEEKKAIEAEPKWRSITEAVKALKEKDPDTAITECFIRKLVKNGQIRILQIGAHQKVDLEEIKRYLKAISNSNKERKEPRIKPMSK